MCGICGYVSRQEPSNELMMLATNTFLSIEDRGNQASGIAYLDEAHKSVIKNPIPARSFVSTVQYKEFLCAKPSIAIFHTRLATSGSVNDNNNNHPFQLGGLVWVHNGIIWNSKELTKEFNLQYKGECDSYIIGLLIDHFLREGKDIVTAIRKAGKKLRGSFAVALIYKGKLYLFNGGGDLFYTTFGGSIVFASGKKYIYGNEIVMPCDKEIPSGTIIEIGQSLKVRRFEFKFTKTVWVYTNAKETSTLNDDVPPYMQQEAINQMYEAELDETEYQTCEVCKKMLLGSDYDEALKRFEDCGLWLCHYHGEEFSKRYQWEMSPYNKKGHRKSLR